MKDINGGDIDAATRGRKIATTVIEPVVPLTPEERLAFNEFVSSREVGSWSPSEIRVITNLARDVVLAERFRRQIDEEGYTVTNSYGTVARHPLCTELYNINASMLQWFRALGISAAQRGMTSATQRDNNKADAEARKVIDKARGSKGLLASFDD